MPGRRVVEGEERYLSIWLQGPFTLKEALERYGRMAEEALAFGLLKVVMTREGGVLVPTGRGRELLGLTRFYTPRPSSLEEMLGVRRYAEENGYRVIRPGPGGAILEKGGQPFEARVGERGVEVKLVTGEAR